jgi:serine/threonine-protein kinase
MTDSTGGNSKDEPTRIGRYDVIGELGRDGTGVLYRGIDRKIGREAAIKMLADTEPFPGDPRRLELFLNISMAVGQLNHPKIVIVYELGDHEGIPYNVMEWPKGETLDRLIQAGAPLSLSAKLKIVGDVCSALGYGHRRGFPWADDLHLDRIIMHLDVKPSNIFVLPDGAAKLMGFGNAQLRLIFRRGMTRSQGVIGTMPYMAPERLRGDAFDGRSDIFAAGVVLYQLVTGRLPFDGPAESMLPRILTEAHAPLNEGDQNYPSALERVIDRALAKPPNDRYQTAEQMALDLSAIIAELQAPKP